MVQLTDDLLAALDAEAARRRLSRSAVIREAVEAHVAADRAAAVGAAVAEGYRRIPQGVPDTWGELETTAEAEAEAALRRLDAEDGGFPR